MAKLIKYELKKILMRRATLFTAIAVFALLLIVYCLNVYSQNWADENLETVSGFTAIALQKEAAEELAGTVSNERITKEFREYKAFFKGEGELKDEFSSEHGDTYSFFNYDNTHYDYLSTFLAPWMNGYENNMYVIWRVNTEAEVDLYDAAEGMLNRQLDSGINGTWEYSEAERSFWHTKYASTAKPLEYGYSKGWMTIFDCFDFLMLVLLAICVGITPVFAAEYHERTAALVLATRFGKNKLIFAKIIASFVFALGMMLLGLLIAIGLPLLFYGSEGAGLPVQLMSISIPYALTMAQAVTVCAVLALFITLGLTAFMLFISAQWKSLLGIMMVGVALVFIPMFLPLMSHGVVAHLATLLPSLALSFGNQFRMLLSYPIGSLVLDSQTITVLFYLLIAALFVPLAMRAFKRHQVSY